MQILLSEGAEGLLAALRAGAFIGARDPGRHGEPCSAFQGGYLPDRNRTRAVVVSQIRLKRLAAFSKSVRNCPSPCSVYKPSIWLVARNS